jgi:hypothetical protein
MTLDQGSEGSFVLTIDEAGEELLIGQPSPVRQKYAPAKVLEDLVHLAGWHVPFRGSCHDPSSTWYLPHEGGLIHEFP